MIFYNLLKILSFFFLIAFSEMILGTLRTLYLNKRLGVKLAKQISILPALLLCFVICYIYLPFFDINSKIGFVFLGIGLSYFMLIFDIIVGRIIMKMSWQKIFDDFNIFKGNFLSIGLTLMALCPLFAFLLKTR